MNKTFSKNEIEKYIELYDTEKYLYTKIGVEARQRGFLTFPEFFSICMWKSSRPKKRYLKNKNIVENITREAFSEVDELKKIKLLCSLEGVGIPTASALLSVVFPDKYPVIDIRCLEYLNSVGYNISMYITEKVWVKYLEIMKQIASSLEKTPRDIDMAFFAMHRESLEQNGFRNLYEVGDK